MGLNRIVLALASLAAAMLAALSVATSLLTPVQATVHGENGRIAYSQLEGTVGEDFEIYTMRSDGSDVRRITDMRGRDQRPTWSPDGTRIGWVRGNEFWVHDIETGRQLKVVRVENGIGSAVVWSPAGTKLAYASRRPKNAEAEDIFVMKADGTNQRRLTSTRGVHEWNVTWSPDGSELAFTRHRYPTTHENQPDVYVVDADGTNAINLTDTMPQSISAGHPSWSPDGTTIAFLGVPWSGAPGTPGIYVVKADGSTDPVNITSATTPGLYGPPVWSPDGTDIAFVACPAPEGEDCDIYVMKADGNANPTNITNRPADYALFGFDAGHTLDWQALPDDTPPRVIRTKPASGATCVDPGANVLAFFSEAMKASTIGTRTIKLYREGSTSQVSADIRYGAAKKRAIIDPNDPLAGGTYRAVVAIGVQDPAGNRLDQDSDRVGLQPKSWFFTVGAADSEEDLDCEGAAAASDPSSVATTADACAADNDGSHPNCATAAPPEPVSSESAVGVLVNDMHGDTSDRTASAPPSCCTAGRAELVGTGDSNGHLGRDGNDHVSRTGGDSQEVVAPLCGQQPSCTPIESNQPVRHSGTGFDLAAEAYQTRRVSWTAHMSLRAESLVAHNDPRSSASRP